MSYKTYKGFFKPHNEYKYIGTTPIIYRSSWESAVMKWCDQNPNVIRWGSESVIIPYLYSGDQKVHRYYIDFIIEFKNKGIFLVELKPLKRITVPKLPKSGRKTRTYLCEVVEYEKNICKWLAAKRFAEEKGFTFQVWTENNLKDLGIKII